MLYYCVFTHCDCPGHQTEPFHLLFIYLSKFKKGVCPERLNQVLAHENGAII